MENEIEYKKSQEDIKYKKRRAIALVVGIYSPLILSGLIVRWIGSKNSLTLKQKTQNEITIDSAKVDTTNYQNRDTINYFDYKKQ